MFGILSECIDIGILNPAQEDYPPLTHTFPCIHHPSTHPFGAVSGSYQVTPRGRPSPADPADRWSDRSLHRPNPTPRLTCRPLVSSNYVSVNLPDQIQICLWFGEPRVSPSYIRQGCHTSGKSQGKVFFFKVREMSGNFEICQGKNEF